MTDRGQYSTRIAELEAEIAEWEMRHEAQKDDNERLREQVKEARRDGLREALDGLADMVPELEWDVSPRGGWKKGLYRSGNYRIFRMEHAYLFMGDEFFGDTGLDQAKSAANAHHRKTILAEFGVTE